MNQTLMYRNQDAMKWAKISRRLDENGNHVHVVKSVGMQREEIQSLPSSREEQTENPATMKEELGVKLQWLKAQ